MAQLTLLDIAKLNGNDKVVGLIEESLPAAPEVSVFPARTIKGTSYYTVVRTGRPAVAFRDANSGAAAVKSTFDKRLTECFILSASVNVDKAVAAAYEDGSAALEMIEAAGVMKQALVEVGNQIWYGTTTDAKGFPGLKAQTAFGGSMTVAATGTDALSQSSVYAVKFGPQDLQLLFGNGTTIELSEFADQQLYDASTLPYPGRVASLTGWVGLQIGNANAVGRIANVGDDDESGDGCTDSLLAQLMQKFPVGYMPNAFFMSRRSCGQLQRSRTIALTTVNPGPAAAPERRA